MTGRIALGTALTLAVGALAAQPPKPPSPSPVSAFVKAHCVACHNAKTAEGKLDLTALPLTFDRPDTAALWVKVHDRVRDGEMPPPGIPPPPPAARTRFLQALATPLIAADRARARREGRAVWRRMNRYEYENTLRDLLNAPWLPLREQLPEDGQVAHFNKVGEALDISYVQMNRYLTAAEYALREVLAQERSTVASTTRRYYTREQPSFTGPMVFTEFNGSPERATFPLLDNAVDLPVLERTAPLTTPANRDHEAVGVVASAYEPLEPKFNRFRAPIAGHYTLRLSAYSFWAAPENEKRWWQPSRKLLSAGRTQEPVTLYAETPPRQLRRLGTVDFGPQPGVQELRVYLLKGETIRPDAVRLFRSRPPGWHNPLAQPDGQPGVAFRWLEVEGPLPASPAPPLFGAAPQASEAEGLVRRFVARAFRRPLRPGEAEPFVKLLHASLAQGDTPTEALVSAYAAVLCSPAFLTLEEKPGALDNHALASRLSYFLINSEPDVTLRARAQQGALTGPGALRQEAERLLADPKAQRFVEGFLDYWLDLRKVSHVSPDETLYPDYYLDDYLLESAQAETRAFFTTLIRDDLPARHLVASNFVTVNDRLAALYGIPGVQGAQMRRVALPPDSPRGGLLTQASVLKVTANGTTTSPVLRGAWITERLLGQPVPPPPAAVPAVEPDIRGATTIRQQLDRHRSDATCRGCHAKIDPPGFALESFDVCGAWRDTYRALGPGTRVPGFGKNGQPFTFHPGPAVDSSGVLPDGRAFRNVRDLKQLLASDERQIARNLVRQLVIYATGAPVRFGDRPQVEAILDRARPSGYGVKSLLLALVESELFRNK